MHSKRQKRTVEQLTWRRSWKSCSTAKTKALARIPLPFLQPSYALLLRFEKVASGNPVKLTLYGLLHAHTSGKNANA